MRVVHIIKAKGIAGAERHLLDLMEGLRARGVDARLLALAEPNTTADSLIAAAEARGVPVTVETIHRHLDPTLLNRLRRHIVGLQPQIVHTHLIHADFYGIPAARLARVPVVITSRHNDDPRRRRLPVKLVNQVLWRMVSAGVAISEAVRRFSIQVEGAPARKIHTIHYGLPLPVKQIDKPQARKALRGELEIAADAPVIGMVCRLIDAKGLPDALQAFSRVGQDHPNLHFVIAGEGPLRRDLEMLARSLRVEERVHFLGWRDDPMTLMAGLDILLMPSVREGFGMSMLEAMAHSIPIIGSTASAIPEVIANGENGLTVPPRSPAALADALRTLLADKPLRMHMGMLGEDRLERLFSADLMIDRTLELYRRLMG